MSLNLQKRRKKVKRQTVKKRGRIEVEAPPLHPPPVIVAAVIVVIMGRIQEMKKTMMTINQKLK